MKPEIHDKLLSLGYKKSEKYDFYFKKYIYNFIIDYMNSPMIGIIIDEVMNPMNIIASIDLPEDFNLDDLKDVESNLLTLYNSVYKK